MWNLCLVSLQNNKVLLLLLLQACQFLFLPMMSMQLVSSFTIKSNCYHLQSTRKHIVSKKNMRIPKSVSSHPIATIYSQKGERSNDRNQWQLNMVRKDSAMDITQVLNQYNFDKRLTTIHKSELPIVGEMYASGTWKLVLITGFKAPNSLANIDVISSQEEIISPLLEVLMIDSDTHCDHSDAIESMKRVVDLGSITTIWKFPVENDIKGYAKFLSKALREVKSSFDQEFLTTQGETLMQSLYESRVQNTATDGRKSGGSKPLTKKEIGRIASSFAAGDDNYQNHIQQILRKAAKAGLGDDVGRLVDSLSVASILFKGGVSGKAQSKTQILLAGASLLAMDAELGGRFKRNPCIFVSSKLTQISNDSAASVDGIALLNGGWLAVDEAVRAGAEARKFAERCDAANSKGKISSTVFTVADERIMYRLECLAMGEELGGNLDETELEVDVRETLSALSLAKSPEGAQQALVKVGRWSPLQKEEIEAGRRGIQQLYNPWSPDILSCARTLRNAEKERRTKLYKMCSKAKYGTKLVDKRKDLTSLPAVCIDAKRASFRDDAIGVRPRSSTGRNVKKGCKWELLIHIADVSDIYSTDVSTKGLGIDLISLRQAAESRGTSRYDLPLGPLHLMPPVALEALALDTNRSEQPSVNRCVTLWVYIDEKSGKILDAGLERTIVRKPIALSFEEATQVFFCAEDIISNNAKQSKPLLLIADKILSAWKGYRLQNNEAAQKREKRLQVREMVAREMQGAKQMRDDGAKGSFQRSRGHQIVDNALDLYGSTLSSLLSRSKAPIPRASGSGASRAGRLGTAPLRRYIDGIAQKQALSVLCNYGGAPLTRKECSDANEIATKAMNKINNLKSKKKVKDIIPGKDGLQRNSALRKLAKHFATNKQNKRLLAALSTGKNNQVVLSGFGLMVRCNNVDGTLKSGEHIVVDVTKLDTQKGAIQVSLVERR